MTTGHIHVKCFPHMPLLMMQVYGWPFNLTRKFNIVIRPYKTRLAASWARVTRCCGRKQADEHAVGVGARV